MKPLTYNNVHVLQRNEGEKNTFIVYQDAEFEVGFLVSW